MVLKNGWGIWNFGGITPLRRVSDVVSEVVSVFPLLLSWVILVTVVIVVVDLS